MRWTCLCILTTVASTSLDGLAQREPPTIEAHTVSPLVQEALDELRHASSHHTFKSPSKSTRLLAAVGSILFANTPAAPSTQTVSHAITGPIERLREASTVNDDVDATFLLAELSMHGNFSYPRNYFDAAHYYSKLAETTGNMTAHENLALLYSTGLQGIQADQGLALVHHTFAASQGSMRSHMALGYRYLQGIGVAPNCSVACEHYAIAATAALEWMYSGPPGGMYFSRKAYQYSDDFGGLYGSAPTLLASGTGTSEAKELDDVIDYYTYIAEKGDIQACFSLAKLYNDGTRSVDRDFVKSLYWFRQVARTYWTKDGKTVKGAKAMRHHAKSAAYIATAYLRGEGTDQDFEKAKKWFLRGVALGDPTAQNGFALMHLLGLGPIPKNLLKAEELFKAAADNEHRGAQISLGKILAARNDITGASRLFHSAAAHGRAEAFYFLAQFFHHGIGEAKNCAMATQYYKIVAESVEALHSTIFSGNAAYREGRTEDAIIANLIAAESGYEVGQINVAFLLDRQQRTFSPKTITKARIAPYLTKLKSTLGLSSEPGNPTAAEPKLSDELALLYYSRSAAQQNAEALVKAGDYHYYGYGTVPDAEKAVALWTTAADSRRVPLALWNLGWSYENGVGVDQDFHMAKRYYDACLEVDPKFYLPVSLSLLKLRARSAWNTMVGGSINSIRDDEDTSMAKVTWTSIWTGIKHFWRSQWDTAEMPNGGDDDDDEGTGTFVDEDYPVAAEDLWDTLLVFGICLLVAGIVYARTTWWPHTRRNHIQQAAANNNDNGAAHLLGPNPHVAEWIVRRR